MFALFHSNAISITVTGNSHYIEVAYVCEAVVIIKTHDRCVHRRNGVPPGREYKAPLNLLKSGKYSVYFRSQWYIKSSSCFFQGREKNTNINKGRYDATTFGFVSPASSIDVTHSSLSAPTRRCRGLLYSFGRPCFVCSITRRRKGEQTCTCASLC